MRKRITPVLQQAGDTIIEVFIAVAIISSVLGLAYATINRNTLVIRDTQERTEASKLGQGQIEVLKTGWDDTDVKDKIERRGNNGFCMTTSGGVLDVKNLSGHTVEDDMYDDDFNDYPNECKSLYYHIGIKKVTGLASDTTYQITVRYDRLGADERNEVKLVYRLPDVR